MNFRKCILAFLLTALVQMGSAQGKLRFVQLTDLHLFDAGYNCYEPDATIEHISAIDALNWAVDRINFENNSFPLDFVVITGDLGLANLTSADGTAPSHGQPAEPYRCHENTPISDKWGPVDPETIDHAAVALGCILSKLQVQSIYLVPGNNDVPDDPNLKIESPSDRRTYKAFVEALARQMPGRIRDLSGIVNTPTGAPSDVVRGYWLTGLDTASFKPSGVETTNTSGGADGSCQDPNPSSETSSSRTSKLTQLVDRSNRKAMPLMLFTHVPDLQDPFPGRQEKKSQDGKMTICRYASSWFLNPTAQKAWSSILGNGNLVGVFAGHFHDSDIDRYGGPFVPASAGAGISVRNVYVTPPLSLKNQWQTHYPRRGLAIAEVDRRTVQSYAIRWYTGIDPKRYKSKDASPVPPLARLTKAKVGILVGAFLLLAVLTSALDLRRWLG